MLLGRGGTTQCARDANYTTLGKCSIGLGPIHEMELGGSPPETCSRAVGVFAVFGIRAPGDKKSAR